ETRIDAWMWTIVRNNLIDYFRRARPEEPFDDAAKRARAEAAALAPRGFLSMLVNPVGRNHPPLPDDSTTSYIARAHVTQAIYTLVALQIKLREAGATDLFAIGQALDGPLFKAHPDPFTGKPMRFDARTRTIGFDALPIMVGRSMSQLRDHYGRVAVELAMDR
ncbi:MAG: hypothetical protein KIT18_15610, partial [Burkholderiales bacterium]|nr:hypothetical protein [Burkholderiales bacterium]